jgi:peptide-methionine (R)-S-oxide reductase
MIASPPRGTRYDAWHAPGRTDVRTDEDTTMTIPNQERGKDAGRSAAGYDITPLSAEELEPLAATLTPEERRIILYQGTEAPFCGTLLDNKRGGTYVCRLCGLPLFRSSAKFKSGTGWPSFTEGYDPDHIAYITDRSHGMVRVEIRCHRCGAHLGHVFDDGPPPTGRRYCLNSVSLEFVDAGQPLPQRTRADREAPVKTA